MGLCIYIPENWNYFSVIFKIANYIPNFILVALYNQLSTFNRKKILKYEFITDMLSEKHVEDVRSEWNEKVSFFHTKLFT